MNDFTGFPANPYRALMPIAIGYKCWFCAQRFARKGESPTRWRESFCSWITQRPCEVEASWRWSP